MEVEANERFNRKGPGWGSTREWRKLCRWGTWERTEVQQIDSWRSTALEETGRESTIVEKYGRHQGLYVNIEVAISVDIYLKGKHIVPLIIVYR